MINALTHYLRADCEECYTIRGSIETQNTSSSSATKTSNRKRKRDSSEGCIKNPPSKKGRRTHPKLPPDKRSVFSKKMEKSTTPRSIETMGRMVKLTLVMTTSKKVMMMRIRMTTLALTREMTW